MYILIHLIIYFSKKNIIITGAIQFYIEHSDVKEKLIGLCLDKKDGFKEDIEIMYEEEKLEKEAEEDEDFVYE